MVNAILAAVLSFIIPGLGQAIAGDIKKGAIFFIIAILIGVILVYVLGLGIIGSIVQLIYAIYAAYDAYQVAQQG